MVYIFAHADGHLDFDALIESICILYPGAAVTDPDYYATRIARGIEIAKSRNMPIPNAPLECMARVSKEHGIQRELFVPICNGTSWKARLDRYGCSFLTDRDGPGIPTIEDVQPLIDLLMQAGLKLEIDGFDGSA